MSDIDRVQSMGEPPRRPRDHQVPRRTPKPESENIALREPDLPEREPEPEHAGTIDLRV